MTWHWVVAAKVLFNTQTSMPWWISQFHTSAAWTKFLSFVRVLDVQESFATQNPVILLRIWCCWISCCQVVVTKVICQTFMVPYPLFDCFGPTNRRLFGFFLFAERSQECFALLLARIRGRDFQLSSKGGCPDFLACSFSQNLPFGQKNWITIVCRGVKWSTGFWWPLLNCSNQSSLKVLQSNLFGDFIDWCLVPFLRILTMVAVVCFIVLYPDSILNSAGYLL